MKRIQVLLSAFCIVALSPVSAAEYSQDIDKDYKTIWVRCGITSTAILNCLDGAQKPQRG